MGPSGRITHVIGYYSCDWIYWIYTAYIGLFGTGYAGFVIG